MSRLVVLSAGTTAQVGTLQAGIAVPMASSLALVWDDQWQSLCPDDQPHLALQRLADQAEAAAPELLGLPLDPGLLLPGGGHWAEALGAWRQPALLVLSAEQGATGLPAAMTALLERWQVPLLGLVQWGDPWDQAARRSDGLPWLGAISPGGEACNQELRLALVLAWQGRLI